MDHYCPKDLIHLAKQIVVPQDYWHADFPELNKLLKTGEFDNVLPAIEGTDGDTRRKIKGQLTWFFEGNCRLDQINAYRLCWPFGRFEQNPENKNELTWKRLGKRNVNTGEPGSNNSRSRSPSPSTETLSPASARPSTRKIPGAEE